MGKNKSRNRAETLPCRDDLLGSLEHAWQMLSVGAENRRSPFHLATVATVEPGGRPTARIVVLRDCDRSERCLRFHTDRRSPKFEQLKSNPEAEMLFYDEYEKIQLRLAVRIEALGTDESDAIWESTPDYSRECYRVVQSPGSEIDAPHSAQFDADVAGGGRDNFAPMRARIESMEWLYLSSQQHRRARFVFTPDGVDATWLVP